jgi:hypothetical protein
VDAVYVVRAGDRNEELRYSLRSIVAHLPRGRVWIVGHAPRWVSGVEHLPTVQASSRFANSRANLLHACEHPDVPERFVLMHDDFFILLPVEAIPVLHRGSIGRTLGARRPTTSYRRALATVRDVLIAGGVAVPLDYELHVPLVVEKASMLETLRREVPVVTAAAVRSLYGNLNAIGGEEAVDVKIHATRTSIPEDAAFVSTTDSSFANGRVGAEIRARFPEPSPFER